MPDREMAYGLAGRAAGEAVLRHGRDGARLLPADDAYLLSRVARAIVDTLYAEPVCMECRRPLDSPGCQLNSGITAPYHHDPVWPTPVGGDDARCPACGGSGDYFSSADHLKCTKCGGTGRKTDTGAEDAR